MSDSFDPLEFLGVAEYLANNDATEADFRTAVSRTYYAVFLVVRDRFRVEGRRNIHGRVMGVLRSYDKIAGERFDSLRDLRTLADYRLRDLDTLDRNWEDNYRKARRFAELILERLA